MEFDPNVSFYSKSRVARQIFILFCLAALLPVLYIGLISYDQVSDQLRQNSLEQSRQLAKVIGIELKSRMDLEASRLDYSQEVSEKEASRLTQDQFDFLEKGKTLVQIEAKKNEPARLIFYRANHIEGKSRRILTKTITQQELFKLTHILPSDMNLMIIGPNREIVFNSMYWLPESLDSLKEGITENISGHFEWAHSGETQLATYWTLFTQPDYGLEDLVILISQSESNALSAITSFRTVYLPGLVLLVLLVALFSAHRIRQRFHPLMKLRHAAQRVAEGHLQEHVQINTGDELEDLGNAFNHMTRQLDSQFSSLETMAEIDRIILSSFDAEFIIETVLLHTGKITTCCRSALLEIDQEHSHQATLSLLDRAQQRQISKHSVSYTDSERKKLMDSGWVTVHKGDAHPFGFTEKMDDAELDVLQLFPIRIKEKLAAVLVCGYSEAPHESSSQQLRKFADHIAVALSNARWEERLYHQAHYDSLTGLPNRALLKDRLEQAIQRAKRNRDNIAVMFVDLDQFKVVNDSLGHSAGDRLLKECAKRLSNCVRGPDTVVRFGGDEFVIIIPDIKNNTEDVVDTIDFIAINIIKSLRKDIFIENHALQMQASIGIAIYPNDADTDEKLIKCADVAMYHAKESGRNNFKFYTDDLNAEAVWRLDFHKEISNALERDEFLIYYQPKFNCHSVLVGAEALIRWQHPKKGFVSPAEFIPLAEKLGLISHIGDWVLRNVCRDIKVWKADGLGVVPVSINVSTQQLQNSAIVPFLKTLLFDCHIDAECIELEVTETAIMGNTEDSIRTLNSLHDIGVSLAVDDFGTGHSSLSYLKDLPLDVLKIDRAFVNAMESGSPAKAIVSTIIHLAHSLNMKVVAEGVENKEQFEQLAEWGCDAFQGYLLGRPETNETYTKILEDHEAQDEVLIKGL